MLGDEGVLTDFLCNYFPRKISDMELCSNKKTNQHTIVSCFFSSNSSYNLDEMRSVDRIVSENYHHTQTQLMQTKTKGIVAHFKALQTHAQTFGRYKKGTNTGHLIMFTHSFHFVSVMSIFFQAFPRKKSRWQC